jgi:hypothetical protein
MLRKLTDVLSILVFTSVLTTAANASAPDWLHNLAQEPAKTYVDDAIEVVLIDDQ